MAEFLNYNKIPNSNDEIAKFNYEREKSIRSLVQEIVEGFDDEEISEIIKELRKKVADRIEH